MSRGISIYTIMTCTKLEPQYYPSGRISGFADYGRSRVVGFFTNYADAQKALRLNSGDMFETVYEYACIERVEEGLFQSGYLMGWYQYDKGKDSYLPIDIPEYDKHTCGRTIG